MKVTRDVVLDLLPLYVAGEVSADTRALVDEFLRQDPDLERRALEARLELLGTTGARATAVPPELELRSLRRTRSVLRWQRLTYAWALAFSLLPLSSVISFEGGQLHFRLLFLDSPSILAPLVMLALSFWAGYFLLRKRARVPKL